MHLKNRNSKATIISFFAGAGFLDLGFEKAGFNIGLVNEIFSPFVEAYKFSRNNMGIPEPEYGFHTDNIENFLTDSSIIDRIIKKNSLQGNLVGFIGGPPCPDFSIGGKNKGHTGDNGRLTGVYIDLIIKKQPDFFVFENVKGLWRTKKHKEFYNGLKEKLKRNGYSLEDKLINSISYGAPQDRERIILFGIKKKLLNSGYNFFDWDKYAVFPDKSAFKFDWPTHDNFISESVRPAPRKIPRELTVEHWFNKNGVYKHPNSKHCFIPKAGLAKFKVIPEGDDSKKSYKRLHRWRYSPTACYGNNEVHLHPYLERRITVSEALAIQSLPKEFVLPDTMTLTNMFKTIGNGVPFLASFALARTIKDFLNEVMNEKTYSTEYSECDRQVAAQYSL